MIFQCLISTARRSSPIGLPAASPIARSGPDMVAILSASLFPACRTAVTATANTTTRGKADGSAGLCNAGISSRSQGGQAFARDRARPHASLGSAPLTNDCEQAQNQHRHLACHALPQLQ